MCVNIERTLQDVHETVAARLLRGAEQRMAAGGEESTTTGKAGGLRKAPERGQRLNGKALAAGFWVR